MEFTWLPERERSNIRAHGLDFSLARQVLENPLADTLLDRVLYGEERWRTTGTVRGDEWLKTLVIILTYPNPDDDTRVHVLSLREATAHERRRYAVPRL